jgi:nuclear protein localization family protein 4
MLVRVRCKQGNYRYEVTPETDLSELVSKVLAEAPEADPATLTFSNQPRGGEQLVLGHKGSLQQFGIS